MARTYRRDARGRFAGGGGGSKPKATGGTLAARGSLKRSKAKAAANASPQQRGAITRGTNRLQAAKAASRRTLKSAPRAGTMRGTVKRNPAAGKTGQPANGIRSIKRQPKGANSIRPVTIGGKRRPLLRESKRKIKAYANQLIKLQGVYNRGSAKQSTKKGAKSVATAIKAFGYLKTPRNNIAPSPRRGSLPPKRRPPLRDRLSSAKGQANAMGRRMARQSARDIAGRLKGGIDGMISGITQQHQGRRLNAAGQNQIRRRAARATAAAARGSKPAARAREIYGAQLASTGPGKGSKGRNNVQPGPRNTKGKPKKARKSKG